MKKRTTLLALGIILSSQMLPVMAQADTLFQNPQNLADAPPNTSLNTVTDSNSEEDIVNLLPDKTAEEGLEVSSPELESENEVSDQNETADQAEVTSFTEPDYITVSPLVATDYNWTDASGNNSNVTMSLDDAGILTIQSGSISNPKGLANIVPKANVKKIIFAGQVTISGNARYLFQNMSELTEIEGLSNLNTANVTDMGYLFNNCSKLTSLDLSGLSTSNATAMEGMFSYCSSLTSLNLAGINTENVINMNQMFEYTSSLQTLDVSHFNTSNVTTMVGMFKDTAFTDINLSNFETKKVENMSQMFNNSSLTSIDLSHLNLDEVFSIQRMFESSTNLKSVKLGGASSNNLWNMFRAFWNCQSLESVDFGDLNTSNMTNYTGLFGECRSLTTFDSSQINTSNAEAMEQMFYNCTSLESLNLQNFVTSKVSNMNSMFAGTTALKALDLTSFDTSKVTYMNTMFSGSGVENLNLSSFTTTASTNMQYMFAANNLSQLTLGTTFNFNGGNLPNIEATSAYSGYWQNVGTGSVEEPVGSNVWTSAELMANYNGSQNADTYVWQKAEPVSAPVTVNYLDKDRNPIGDAVTLQGELGEAFETTEKSFNFYKIKEVEGDTTGVFTEEAQVINYIYADVAAGDVTIEWVDENNDPIAPSENIPGVRFGNYSSEQKTFDAYTFVEQTGAATSGAFTEDAQKVTYHYVKKDGANVTVRYLDEGLIPISPDEILSGKYDDSYETSAKTIPGYKFKEVDGDEKGKFTGTEQTVTYIYSKRVSAPVTVNYLDKDRNPIGDAVTLEGELGEAFEATEKSFNFYKFKAVEGDTTGVFTEDAQIINYIYADVAAGDVTIEWLDENNDPIVPSEIIPGVRFESYSSEQKTFDAYTFVEQTGAATSGAFTEDAQKVTYHYVKKDGANVTVRYLDEDRNPISADEILSGKYDDSYETSAKTISGYKFKEVDGDEKGKFTGTEQTVTYIYSVDDGSNGGNSTDNGSGNNGTGTGNGTENGSGNGNNGSGGGTGNGNNGSGTGTGTGNGTVGNGSESVTGNTGASNTKTDGSNTSQNTNSDAINQSSNSNTLPSTGVEVSTLPFVIGVILSAFSFIFYGFKKKKND